jgi:hypothetical protein
MVMYKRRSVIKKECYKRLNLHDNYIQKYREGKRNAKEAMSETRGLKWLNFEKIR